MEVKEAIEKRRAYRALEPVDITDAMVRELAWAASMAPSCFNNQPWRLLFVRTPEMLEKMHAALSKGNEWMRDASMLLVVLSKKEFDCVIREREYYQFDTGIAVGLLMLMATGMGLVAHPVAGFSPKRTREILGIPEDVAVITVMAIGKKSHSRTDNVTDEQWNVDSTRPVRLKFPEFVYMERYS
jgi:nitroreductase